ncbi:MAG: hypothetical protein K0Q43_82 [Ramlibacter sp.]|jgi:hypothetical protein|nr:hypothetical protein [Ramlibacter sp.]
MTPRQLHFLQRLVAQKPAERRNEGTAAEMAVHEGVGRRDRSRIQYAAADFVKAQNILITRGYPVEAPASGFTRSSAPAGGSEKTGARAVSQDLVAAVPLNMAFQLPPGTNFVAMAWQDAVKLPFSAVLLCENLEALRDIRSYAWLDGFVRGRPTLAVFRGAPGYFRTDAPAALLRATDAPVLGFFDLDPQGLCFAAGTLRLEALLLPPVDVLEQRLLQLKRRHLFTQQFQKAQAQLEQLPEGQLRDLWQLLKRHSLGLDQEGFPREL